MNELAPIEVLLVEDNPHDSEFTLAALRRECGLRRIVHLQDGQAALDYLHCQGAWTGRPGVTPLLTLMDLKLPKVDGLEVLRRVREHAFTATQPVVILTSSREESDLLAAYRLGVNSYIVKPIAAEDFARVVTLIGKYWVRHNQSPVQALYEG